MTDATVYAALSVHGSNAFISASRTFNVPDHIKKGDKLTIGQRTFSVVDKRGGNTLKLHIPDLEGSGTSTSGISSKSINDPVKIFNTFQELRNEDWEIKDEGFIRKHRKELFAANLIDAVNKPIPKTPEIAKEPVQEQVAPIEQLAQEVKSGETVSETAPPIVDDKTVDDKAADDKKTLVDKAQPIGGPLLGSKQLIIMSIIKEATLPISFDDARTKFADRLAAKVRPSDFMRSLDGLVKHKLIETDHKSITKVN